MTEHDAKRRLHEALQTMPAEMAKLVREAVRKHKPELLADEHADLGDHRHHAVPPPAQGRKGDRD